MRVRNLAVFGAAAIAAACAFVAASGPASAKGGGGSGGGGSTVDPVVIYYTGSDVGGFGRMNVDGSGRTAIPLPATPDTAGAVAMPSRLLHGGKRWFLQWHETGSGFYRDGRTPRVAMFAVDETGATRVQLTDDMSDVVPDHNGWWVANSRVAWVGLNDERVSYQGYTLDADGRDGKPAQRGVWTADVTFDAATGVPVSTAAASTLVPGVVPPDCYQGSPPYGYMQGISWAWSPDGSQLAYSEWIFSTSVMTGMWRINADGTGNTQYFDGSTPRTGWLGSWSSKGRIAYWTADGTTIMAMNADGSNATTLVASSRGMQKKSARWSPAGNYLVYLVTASSYVDVRRVAADGSGDTSLSGRLTWGSVVDWR
jgi:hypothetical protein